MTGETPPDNRGEVVNRTPTQTACTGAHSVSQYILNRMITFHHANTRDSRLHIFCVPKQWSSTCHVSFLAAPNFSLAYFTNLSDNLTNTHKTFGARSIFTLRSSTAEWRINTKSLLSQSTENRGTKWKVLSLRNAHWNSP